MSRLRATNSSPSAVKASFRVVRVRSRTPEPVLDARHQLGQGRGVRPEIGRRGGKTAALDHADEGIHFGRCGAEFMNSVHG